MGSEGSVGSIRSAGSGIGQVSSTLLVISVTCSDPISAQVNTVVQPVILSLALGLHLAGTGFEAHYCFHCESFQALSLGPAFCTKPAGTSPHPLTKGTSNRIVLPPAFSLQNRTDSDAPVGPGERGLS